MTVHQEGQAMNGNIFNAVPFVFVPKKLPWICFVDSSGFLSSMTFCISMQLKLEFLGEGVLFVALYVIMSLDWSERRNFFRF